MTDKTLIEQIARQRYHGLYLSRQCPNIVDLSRELLGLHCWFHRNVAFSALIRGADIAGWKHALTKTWLYRGTLHGAVYGELPKLLSLHKGESWPARYYGEKLVRTVAEEVLRYMEDGVYSRAPVMAPGARVFSKAGTSPKSLKPCSRPGAACLYTWRAWARLRSGTWPAAILI